MNKYYISANTIPSYGVLILSKYPGIVQELKFKNLTKMGRSLL